MNEPFDKQAVITTILVVSDIEKSKEFYCDILGAELFREYGGDSLVLKLLGSWFLLVLPGGPTVDKPNHHFRTSSSPHEVTHAFTIRVQDCAETYNKLNKKGVEFITPPFTNGPETRCFFTDPDGHLFEISEYRG